MLNYVRVDASDVWRPDSAVPLRDNVRRLRKGRGLSLNALGKAAGLSATQIKEIEDGKNTEPGPTVLKKLSTALEVSLSDLLADETTLHPIDHDEPRPEHTVTVPVEAVVVGGDPTEAAEMPEETYELLHHLQGPDRHVIRLFGNSMWFTYWDGDLLLVDPRQKVASGEVAVVRIDTETTVKRIFKRRGGGFWLKADNPTFPPIDTEGKDVSIVAKVLKIVEGVRP